MNTVLKKVNKVYKEVNPSTYLSSINKKNILRLEKQRRNLFHNKLNLPIELFKNKKLLDLGSGTGMYSIIYNLWGADCTLVEYDKYSHEKAKIIFNKFQRKNSLNNFVKMDLFKFKNDLLYDIVHCNGVLHHTANKNKGIKIMADNLKKGGIFILGASIVTGFFQRNLQRLFLYKISKNKREIIKNAKTYFGEHLNRAAKGSGRSVLAVIYDSYINSKIDSYSLKDLLKELKKNKISFYSSFPNIINIKENELEWKFVNKNIISEMSLNFTNLIWFMRSKNILYKKNKILFEIVLNLSKIINNISFDQKKKFEKKIIEMKKNLKLINDQSFTKSILFNSKANIFFNEINKLLNIIENQDYLNVKKFKQNKFLFKGFSGLGMNYFVGFKS